jgi:ATP-dependent phosphofructokinase / diphosphate-dependent phosphofructokinase
MPQPKKKIAVLTSGGDCAGLNAALYAVTQGAIQRGWDVIGIRKGTHGLLEGPPDVIALTGHNMPKRLLREGGTILGTTNKGDPFAYPTENGQKKDFSADIIRHWRSLEADALVAIGGDGSLDIIHKLAKLGNIPVVGIPKTIDNDVAGTELAIGYDTAVAVATEAIDRLIPTAASHDRVMIVEVMGRDAGFIALAAGIAGGADVILIPELPFSIEAIVGHILAIKKTGRNYAIIVVSEAVKAPDGARQKTLAGGQIRYGGIGEYLSSAICEATGAETRVTVLGHTQRGGTPTANDRLLAQSFACHALELIEQKQFDRVVVWQNRKATDLPIDAIVNKPHCVQKDDTYVRTARNLGICLGGE